MILFPERSRFVRESDRMRELEHTLRNLGLIIEVVVVPEDGAYTNLTIGEIEDRGRGSFFIVQVNRRDGDAITTPPKTRASRPATAWSWSAATARRSARSLPPRASPPAADAFNDGAACPPFTMGRSACGTTTRQPGFTSWKSLADDRRGLDRYCGGWRSLTNDTLRRIRPSWPVEKDRTRPLAS